MLDESYLKRFKAHYLIKSNAAVYMLNSKDVLKLGNYAKCLV